MGISVWVESGSGPFFCTIETLKYLMFYSLWMKGSHLDGVDAGLQSHPFVVVYMNKKIWGTSWPSLPVSRGAFGPQVTLTLSLIYFSVGFLSVYALLTPSIG